MRNKVIFDGRIISEEERKGLQKILDELPVEIVESRDGQRIFPDLEVFPQPFDRRFYVIGSPGCMEGDADVLVYDRLPANVKVRGEWPHRWISYYRTAECNSKELLYHFSIPPVTTA